MSLPRFMNPQVLAQQGDTWPGGVAPPAGGRKLRGIPIDGFPLVRQALPNWCWAAVASGVDAVLGEGRTQCEIASLYGPNSNSWTVRNTLRPPCCPPRKSVDTIGYLNEVFDILGLTRTRYSAIVDSDITALECRAELENDRPVPIRIAWSSTSGEGHFITLVGNGDAGTFVVYDPSETHEDEGHLRFLTTAGLASGYDGRGNWSHIYPVKKAKD